MSRLVVGDFEELAGEVHEGFVGETDVCRVRHPSHGLVPVVDVGLDVLESLDDAALDLGLVAHPAHPRLLWLDAAVHVQLEALVPAAVEVVDYRDWPVFQQPRARRRQVQVVAGLRESAVGKPSVIGSVPSVLMCSTEAVTILLFIASSSFSPSSPA